VSEELKEDKELALVAVSLYVPALCFVSENLKKNYFFVNEVLKINPVACLYFENGDLFL